MEQVKDKKKTKKLKKRLIIFGIILVVIAAIVVSAALSAKNAVQTISLSDTAAVMRSDLISSVSATGTVESANSTSVYSSLAYTVKAVHVKVGDTVTKGQLLAELDAESIKNSISTQNVSSQVQQQSAQTQVKSAQDSYDSFKAGIDSGLNANLISAQTQLDNAYTAYQNAQTNLQRYEFSLYSGQNTALNTARSALETAQTALSNAQTAYQADPNEQTSQAVSSAQSAYQNALSAYQAAQTSANNTLEDLHLAVRNAQDAYETAQTGMQATEKAVNDQLQAYADAVAAAKSGTNTAVSKESVRQLSKTLSDTKITAPCDGTVTAVYATVGASGAGLLFVIEDVDHLVVETTIKSYDIGKIGVGQRVLIESDASGDAVYEGTISSIAPTTKKNPMGETDVTSDGVFEAEVAVTSENTALKIGMEAQLQYVISEAKNVLNVPFEAVYQNEDGQDCILLAEKNEKDKYVLRELAVTTGLDDDLDIAVEASELSEGMTVVQAPERYRPLIGMELSENTATQGAWQVMMQ